MTIPEKYDAICSCLRAAEQAAKWTFWRSRFNTNHPDHVRSSEISDPDRYATVNWQLAKRYYCENRDELDIFYRELQQSPQLQNLLKLRTGNELFEALTRVVNEEMNEQMEKVITDPSNLI